MTPGQRSRLLPGVTPPAAARSSSSVSRDLPTCARQPPPRVPPDPDL